MGIVVVGGHTRNIGKTSVVAGLIAALPERNWTAVKITQHGDDFCPVNGPNCGCAADEHTWRMSEERDPAGNGDTCRFLEAGARRSFWVQIKQDKLGEALPALKLPIGKDENVIFESNSVLGFIEPDIYLCVLDPATRDFKASARRYLQLADAIVLHEPSVQDFVPEWEGVSLCDIGDKPTFRVRAPQYVTPEIVEFVRARLDGVGGHGESD